MDTAQLDKLCNKALTAVNSCRHALAAAFFRRAAEEAFRLHGQTCVCTYLTLQRSDMLFLQSLLEGVTPDDNEALLAEAWALVSSCLPLIVRRMDANTMLPGRGTAVEVAFFKRYEATRSATMDLPPCSTRGLQLAGLSLGYATAVCAAEQLLWLLPSRNDTEAHAFLMRVVDCMLPAARSLAVITLPDEIMIASTIERVLSGEIPTFYATFVASLRTKWTATAMVRMRRERDLLDVSEPMVKNIQDSQASWRADVAEHGLKHCALPSCDKREASVQQYKFCSACRSVWYCSAEHGALHWAEHKPVCRAATAAQQAAAKEGAGAA